jgi:hypothetical protein
LPRHHPAQAGEAEEELPGEGEELKSGRCLNKHRMLDQSDEFTCS